MPLPPDPVFAPGTPEPLYCIEQSNHPFKLLVASIIVPGAANHIPAIPGDAAPVSVDILIEKFAFKTNCKFIKFKNKTKKVFPRKSRSRGH